ncbi:proton gradient regulation 5 [Wolffia australiana]
MAVSLPSAGFRSEIRSAFHGDWAAPFAGGEDRAALARKASAARLRPANPPRSVPMMKNVNEGKGIFAPLVVVTRNIVGKQRFNQLRGKAIALHSQVITEFCKSIGADGKQRQGLIRLAKKNGERLGFLA